MLSRPVCGDVIPAPDAVGRISCGYCLTRLCIGLTDSHGLLESLILKNVVIVVVVPAGGVRIVLAGSALRFRRCCRGIRIGVASDEYLEHIRLPTFIWVQLNYSVKTVRQTVVNTRGAALCRVGKLTPAAIHHGGRIQRGCAACSIGPQHHVKVLHGDLCEVRLFLTTVLYAGIAVGKRIVGVQIPLLKPLIRQRRVEVIVYKVEVAPASGGSAAAGAIARRVISGRIDGIVAGCCLTIQVYRKVHALCRLLVHFIGIAVHLVFDGAVLIELGKGQIRLYNGVAVLVLIAGLARRFVVKGKDVGPAAGIGIGDGINLPTRLGALEHIAVTRRDLLQGIDTLLDTVDGKAAVVAGHCSCDQVTLAVDLDPGGGQVDVLGCPQLEYGTGKGSITLRSAVVAVVEGNRLIIDLGNGQLTALSIIFNRCVGGAVGASAAGHGNGRLCFGSLNGFPFPVLFHLHGDLCAPCVIEEIPIGRCDLSHGKGAFPQLHRTRQLVGSCACAIAGDLDHSPGDIIESS